MIRHGFGSVSAIDPDTFVDLPPVLQAEGFRLMLEAGAAMDVICDRTGFSERHVVALVTGSHAPFRRDGDVNSNAGEKST